MHGRRPFAAFTSPACAAAIACVCALPLAGCDRHEPAAAIKAPAATAAHRAAPSPPRERGEYSAMPDGASAAPATPSTSTEAAIAGEALRGGPHGEPRIFENAQEQAELARGASPRYMNGQFRYYLAGLSVVPAQDNCLKPLLAIRLAVENLHGAATSAIYGRFTFAQTVGGEGSALTETVAIPYRADIIGPFSNKQGGVVYVTAYAEQADAYTDPGRWAEITAVSASRLKVWFTPEAFYYPDGTQYEQRSGNGPATRDVMSCGGGEGATRVLARAG
ncbi:MAG: hypothetical protein ABI364_08470 [Caldimonas sp.]